jgi:transposase
MLEVVQAQPDATCVEFLVILKKRGIRTSRSALWRFFGRQDITFEKKSLFASERQRQDVVRARRKWLRGQGRAKRRGFSTKGPRHILPCSE